MNIIEEVYEMENDPSVRVHRDKFFSGLMMQLFPCSGVKTYIVCQKVNCIITSPKNRGRREFEKNHLDQVQRKI